MDQQGLLTTSIQNTELGFRWKTVKIWNLLSEDIRKTKYLPNNKVVDRTEKLTNKNVLSEYHGIKNNDTEHWNYETKYQNPVTELKNIYNTEHWKTVLKNDYNTEHNNHNITGKQC